MVAYNDSFAFTRIFDCQSGSSGISKTDAEATRSKLGIRIEHDPSGDCPEPISTFEDLHGLPDYVIRALRSQNISEPTAIQAQALPLVLSGRDVVGLAQTGSGKTLAFLLPAVVHMEARQPVDSRWQPLALVLAPTRELAVQISEEAEKILWNSREGNHRNGLHAVAIYGGGNKRDQKEKLQKGVHLLAATPGRLSDFVESEVVSLGKVTYLILDEADRMLDMGFHEEVVALSRRVRPDRQVLFFSATWGDSVQELASGLCDPNGPAPTRISTGQGKGAEEANGGLAAAHQAREGIEQHVIVVDDSAGDYTQQQAQKRVFLERHLSSVLEETDEHKVLVFVSQKKMADDLAYSLHGDGYAADAMHGGRSQEDRLWVLDQFRKGHLRLLVCTDVLGRGIDLPSVSHVVVFEMGAIEDYIHRIGRTGRGPYGKGHALVFFEYWDKNPTAACDLVDVLRASKQTVPDELRRIAGEVSSGRRGGGSTWSSAGGGWGAGGWNGPSTQQGSSGNWGSSGYGTSSNDQKASSQTNASSEQPTAPQVVEEEPAEIPDSWDD